MPLIKTVNAREILDSRGFPTVETSVQLYDGSFGIAAVPSGNSVGIKEAWELRDKDSSRFDGQGVLKAVTNVVDKIAPALIGKEVKYQNKIDQILVDLDATPNKKNLGSNAVLSVSQACLKAAAASYKMPVYAYLWAKYQLANSSHAFPTPCFNVINGGKHGAGNLDFQEFMIVPSSRFMFGKALEIGVSVYQSIKKALEARKAIYSVGDDGGFAPNLFTNMDALELIRQITVDGAYKLNSDIFFGIDVAAGSFFKNGKYLIKDNAQNFSGEEMINYYEELNKQYHLLMLEDPLSEEDWTSWKDLTALLGSKTVIAGDDLLCTNSELVKNAIKLNACNGILIKPNQIGTITETVEVVKMCKEAGWQVIVSGRGGETTDDFIADLAVGMGANYTKFGAPARGEHVVKYNRILAIAAQLKQG